MMKEGRFFVTSCPFLKTNRMKTLPTGVKTTEKKRNGIIRIEVDDRNTNLGKDEYFEQPTLESECSNNTALLVSDFFSYLDTIFEDYHNRKQS